MLVLTVNHPTILLEEKVIFVSILLMAIHKYSGMIISMNQPVLQKMDNWLGHIQTLLTKVA